jgi:hypothetical protein
MNYGTVELGQVCVLLSNKPDTEDKINKLAAEAADRISTTPEAKAKLHAMFLYYMNRAVETAKS